MFAAKKYISRAALRQISLLFQLSFENYLLFVYTFAKEQRVH
jgi:hypothetical protein